MDVPFATYTASNSPADPTDFFSTLICTLGGSVVPFTKEQLLQLYPTHDDYLTKYTQASDKAVADGYLLEADRRDAIELAKLAKVPN
jgi:hypothetical protein